MKWYEYPLIFIVGFVVSVITIILIGFLFLKFFILMFIIGIVVILYIGFSYIYMKISNKEEYDYSEIDKLADSLKFKE